MSKLSNVVKNEVVKKAVHDKLVAKVHNIDTSGFVLKTKYHTDKAELENKISGLVTTSALTAVENKIPSVSNLVKKTDFDTKISELEKKLADHNHDKYITTQEFNKLTAENFAARLAHANLIYKNRF